MLLDQEGKVYSLGRHDYGVLGLGENVNSEVHTPTLVEGIVDPSVEIGCGTAVSYAVTKNGDAFSWGMGTNGQVTF
jgi:regulator of chromosome condensation